MKILGRNSVFYLGSALLAAVWLFAAAAQAATPGAALVKKVVGTANYTDARGGGPLKEGDILMAGATITTGAGSYVDLDMGVNGNALRVEADSTLALNKLDYTRAGETVVNTQVEVKKGSSVSNVINKLSKASKYEIKTAAGVAGIRGTVVGASPTTITCLVGTISFVPAAGGGVQIVITGGSKVTAGALAAVKAGTAETSNLARAATGVTANVAANLVAQTVQQFAAAIAADAAADAGKNGGAAAATQAAADTAKTVMADLLAAVKQAAATATGDTKAIIQAIAANLEKNAAANTADAAAKGAGIAVKVNGGTETAAKDAAKAAAGQTTTDQSIVTKAVENANSSIGQAKQGDSAANHGTSGTTGNVGGGTPNNNAAATTTTTIFVSPTK